MKCELRACCRRGGGTFLSTPDAPRDVDRSGNTLPLITVLPEPPKVEESIAHHEAAHAVAYHAFGGEIDEVTIAYQPQVVGISQPPALPDRLVMLLAGPAGTNAYYRRIQTLFESELADYVARVDDVTFGNCDHCQAALIATVHATKTGGDRVAIFRDAERRANGFVREHRVRAAIAMLACALMEKHTVGGAEAHAIISNYLEFGELANAE